MSSSGLIRWGGIAAMAAGVVWVIYGILAIVSLGVQAPGTFPYYLVEGTFAVGLLLTVVGMVGLHALQKENYGRIGRAGFYTVVLASSGQVLGTVVLLTGSAALAWLVYPVGVLAVLVGFVLYGAATLQARVLPRWCGVGLIVGWPIAIALGLYGGNILFGLLWVALGYVLWSWRGTAAEQPSRVRRLRTRE